MKKTLIFALVLSFLCTGFATLSAQQNAEDAKLKKFQDSYLDAYFKFFPTAGTTAGFAKYNDKLEDLRENQIERFHDSLDGFNQELLTKIDRMKLSPPAQVEYEIMLNALDQEYVRFESLVPWEYNPLFYTELLLDTMRGLVGEQPAALDTRVKCATERAKQLPTLVQRAKGNLKTPPQIYTETAIRQMPAIIEFYRTDVPALVDASAIKAALLSELPKAVAALEDFGAFLQNELLTRSTGNFRLGEVHPRLLRNRTVGTLRVAEDIIPRSTADVTNIRREMALVSIPYFRIMYPQINMEQMPGSEDQVRNAIIQGVLDKIKVQHPEKDAFVDEVAATAADIRTFIQEKNLLAPLQEELSVTAMPPALRGTSWFRLSGPGALDPAGSYAFYIQPLPDAWTPEQTAQFLEEYNDLNLDFLAADKVYPGTFYATVAARKTGSTIANLYPNRALILGWPAAIPELLITSGYQDYNLRLRLMQLKNLLKNAIAFQMDINIHQGTYDKDKVVGYMSQFGFMSRVEAERLFDEIVLNPGDAALTYIGYQELQDMEKEYRQLKGDQFSAPEFLQKVLSYGPIPLRMIKERLAQ